MQYIEGSRTLLWKGRASGGLFDKNNKLHACYAHVQRIQGFLRVAACLGVDSEESTVPRVTILKYLIRLEVVFGVQRDHFEIPYKTSGGFRSAA